MPLKKKHNDKKNKTKQKTNPNQKNKNKKTTTNKQINKHTNQTCDIIVSVFEHQSRYYIYFRTNTVGKGMDTFIPLTMGSIVS